MDAFFRTAQVIGFFFNPRLDDDLVDKLNCWYTPLFLIALSTILATRQTVGDRIACFTPAYFTDSHDQFAAEFCWASKKYWVPSIDTDLTEATRKAGELNFYQWTPLILLVQAIMFNFPSIVWRILGARSSLHLNRLVRLATGVGSVMPPSREEMVRNVSSYFASMVRQERDTRQHCLARCQQFLARNCCVFCGTRYGNHLTSIYLTIKLMFLANLILQLYLIDNFIGSAQSTGPLLGVQLLRALGNISRATGDDTSANMYAPRFPRVTLCEFFIRQPGALHHHVLQCALPGNLFHERVFLLMWFWYAALLLMTLTNFLTWASFLVVRRRRRRYVQTLLRIFGSYKAQKDAGKLDGFVLRFLRYDGVFFLLLLERNVGDVFVAELVNCLWRRHFQKP